jgi:energy-coupling factor transporter ATP-binding protein EcfA2
VKLHRLVLRNYRGIDHRDIEFPDRGVVVVSGANEVGKSSMIEALDLLLEAKDRSTKKEVKQVKPTHVDEGAEITAVMSTGPYRFEYHKRFHKRPETRLTVLAPRREQLTGDEAHERVLAILAETVDTELWRAQRVMQSASTASVDLSGCDALARALDAAAGQSVTLSGSEPLLIDRIDAEFRQYFTATGRATGQWAAAVSRLREAEQQVQLCQAAVDEVDEAVARHGRLSDELAGVALDRVKSAKRVEAARAAADTVKQLTDRLTQVRALAEAAEMTRTASDAALLERRRLRADLTERSATIAGLESAVAAAAKEEAAANEVAVAAVAAAESARAAVEETQVRVDAARQTVERISRRDEAEKLTSRLAKIDAVERQLLGVEEQLAQIALSDEVMRDVELAALTTERAAAQAELASARVELDAADGVSILVAGEAVELGPGGSWSQNVTTATTVEVPGVLVVRVVPGAPAADSQGKLDRARQVLDLLLCEAGVTDVTAARELDVRRRELASERARLRATRDALVDDDAVTTLRLRLAELSAAPGPTDDPRAEDARAALEEATRAHRQARADHDRQRDVAAAVTSEAMRTAGAASVLRSKLASAREEVTAVSERLVRLRESCSDDELAMRVESDGERARSAAAQVLAIDAELAATAPEVVRAELAEATRRATDLDARHDEVAGLLRELTAQLQVYGSEGRKGRLDAALTEREHAAAEHAALQRRSGAAQLLQSVMTRHRDQSRLRYVDPFRAEVERLGRIVFGSDFEVEVDGDLRMVSRTLDGRTVPFESLSGGAKEQLGIVARLATAALVAKEDGVPVVIDDALGFSDPDRLARMGEVFDAVGGDGQVIVLTCIPERYAGIVDAQHLELSG